MRLWKTGRGGKAVIDTCGVGLPIFHWFLGLSGVSSEWTPCCLTQAWRRASAPENATWHRLWEVIWAFWSPIWGRFSPQSLLFWFQLTPAPAGFSRSGGKQPDGCPLAGDPNAPALSIRPAGLNLLSAYPQALGHWDQRCQILSPSLFSLFSP